MSKPKMINTFHADTSDMDKDEIGEYTAYKILYDKYPTKVGDLVIIEVWPYFEDVMERYDYEQVKKYPPDYLVLAEVTRITDKYGSFFCRVLREE